MICKKCGREIRNDVKFCPACGEPVKRSGKILLIPILCVAAAAVFSGTLIFMAFKGGKKTSAEYPETANGSHQSGSLLPGSDDSDGRNYGVILEIEEPYLIAGEKADVLFTAQADDAPGEIELYGSENEVIASLNDDGIDGDVTAGDGIYSCEVELNSDSAGTESFYVKADEVYSPETQVWYFDRPTEESAKEAEKIYDEVVSGIENAESEYLDAEGYIPAAQTENAANDVYEYLNECLDQGILVRVLKENNSIYVKFASGVALVYEPRMKDVSSGGTETELTIWTYQPNPDIATDEVEGGAREAVEEVNNCRFVADYRNEEVTLELVKTLPADEVVLWNGHGGYDDSVKSYLCTGEYWDWNAWFDWEYFTDSVSDRILHGNTDYQKDLVCFTSKFIDKYCGDLSNSLFLLASCYSAQDSTLANAFLNKGADAVLGFSDSVYTDYCLSVCNKIMVYMGQMDPETGDYRTLEAALPLAMEEYGENDLVWAINKPVAEAERKSEVAEPVLIGDGEYQLATDVPPVIYSSNIATYKGTAYWVDHESVSQPASLKPIETLHIEPALYDYICSFAFYEDRVYYACKEAGTSDYSSAIFSCNLDGSDVQEIVNCVFDLTAYDSYFGCTSFYITGGRLYYKGGQEYMDLETGERGSYPPAGAPYSVGEQTFFTQGCGYYVMDTRVWKEKYDPVTDSYGGSEELFDGGIYISLQAAVPTGLYYTTYGDNYGYLYFYEFETGQSILIDRHLAAGGGDAYFNW